MKVTTGIYVSRSFGDQASLFYACGDAVFVAATELAAPPLGFEGPFEGTNSKIKRVFILDGAFRNCFGIRRVELGKNVKSLGEGVFMNCMSLERFS